MSGIRRATRFLGIAVVGVIAVWASAHITVRISLAIPVVLIGVILSMVAMMFRRPPPDLFTELAAAQVAPIPTPPPAPVPTPAPTPASTAIPMPPVTEPPATPDDAATWVFDEPAADPDGETW